MSRHRKAGVSQPCLPPQDKSWENGARTMKNRIVGEYEVREPLVGDVRPIMGLMTKAPEDFQFELAKRCIYKDGANIGDEIANIPFSQYVPLMTAVMELTGFMAGEAGNG